MPHHPSPMLHIVLDLDGTLIDASLNWPSERATLDDAGDGAQSVDPEPDCVVGKDAVFVRPGAHAFLARCLDDCASVSVWSAAGEDWVHGVLDGAFGAIKGRLAFVRCGGMSRRAPTNYALDHFGMAAAGTHRTLKLLSRLWRTAVGQELGMGRHNTIIVEDTPSNCDDNYGNAIYVDSFDWLDAHAGAYEGMRVRRRCGYVEVGVGGEGGREGGRGKSVRGTCRRNTVVRMAATIAQQRWGGLGHVGRVSGFTPTPLSPPTRILISANGALRPNQ